MRSSKVTWAERLRAIATDLAPLGIIMFAVTGLIVLGIATPTEAAALGALSALLLARSIRQLVGFAPEGRGARFADDDGHDLRNHRGALAASARYLPSAARPAVFLTQCCHSRYRPSF